MKLSYRLKGILEWIDCSVLADIGCDHGYLCAAALKENRARRCYACDVNEGPLEQARQTALLEGVQDRMQIRLQNGMAALPKDVDQVVIAGMGGSLIEEILSAWLSESDQKPPLTGGELRFVLSAHKDVTHLRKWLVSHRFHIEKERILHDGHFYPVMSVRYLPDEPVQQLSLVEIECGSGLQKDQDASDYLDYELAKMERILAGMPDGRKTELERRMSAFQKMRLAWPHPDHHPLQSE